HERGSDSCCQLRPSAVCRKGTGRPTNAPQPPPPRSVLSSSSTVPTNSRCGAGSVTRPAGLSEPAVASKSPAVPFCGIETPRVMSRGTKFVCARAVAHRSMEAAARSKKERIGARQYNIVAMPVAADLLHKHPLLGRLSAQQILAFAQLGELEVF